MLAWVFDLLRYRMRKEWTAGDPVRRGYAYSRPQRWFIDRSIRSVLLAGFPVFLSVDVWRGCRSPYSRRASLSELSQPFRNGPALFIRMADFVAVWTIQAAPLRRAYLVGISFVTTLLQLRTYAEAIFYVYLAGPAAILRGLSVFAVESAAGVHYLVIPFASAAVTLLWTVPDDAVPPGLSDRRLSFLHWVVPVWRMQSKKDQRQVSPSQDKAQTLMDALVLIFPSSRRQVDPDRHCSAAAALLPVRAVRLVRWCAFVVFKADRKGVGSPPRLCVSTKNNLSLAINDAVRRDCYQKKGIVFIATRRPVICG